MVLLEAALLSCSAERCLPRVSPACVSETGGVLPAEPAGSTRRVKYGEHEESQEK